MRADEISANVIVALDGLGDFTSNRSTPREGGGKIWTKIQISIYLVQEKILKIIIFKDIEMKLSIKIKQVTLLK